MNLTGGDYTSSLPAAYQRVVNLIPEVIPVAQNEPIRYIDRLAPGLTSIRPAPKDICRAAYTASNGDLYMVYDQSLYYVSPDWVFHEIVVFVGTSLMDCVPRKTPVSMSDNGLQLLIVNGSPDGWIVNLATRVLIGRINDPTLITGYEGFMGSPFVTILDDIFVLSKPNSSIWYVSAPLQSTFDAGQYASKATSPDNIVGILTCHAVLWIIGEFSYEVWYSSGGSGTIINSFPFSRIPQAFTDVGCIAQYTMCTAYNDIFWLAQNKAGKNIVVKGQSDYSTKRISTHSIEIALNEAPTTKDASAYIYQQDGHSFYVLTIPSSNDYKGQTWCYDGTTELWTQRVYTDSNGLEYRHRGQCATEVYDLCVVGDWENKGFYFYDTTNQTDFGNPIIRERYFSHLIDNKSNHRLGFRQFIANMEVGSSTDATVSSQIRTLSTSSFTATDGTLLQDYNNNADINATFTKITGTDAEIALDEMTGISGNSVYSWNGKPDIADYVIQFTAKMPQNIIPSNGRQIFAIGRAVAGAGYKIYVSSDGTNLKFNLDVMTGSSNNVAIGTTLSDYKLILAMNGSNINGSCYRVSDGTWLNPGGSWIPTQTEAISIVDTTYTTIGEVCIGGVWST